MSAVQLIEKIKNGKTGSVLLLYGKEDYLKQHYINEFRENFLTDEQNAFSYICFDGKINEDAIKEFIYTPSFFTEYKICVIKNSGIFTAVNKINKDIDSKNMLQILREIQKSTIIIFSEKTVDKRLLLYKEIKKTGETVELNDQDPEILKKWVNRNFVKSGKKISIKNIEYLLSICENEMNSILRECEKIISFIGDKELVEKTDIDNVCTRSLKSRIFDLIDAIGSGNKKMTGRYLSEILEQGEPVQLIVYMIERQLSMLYVYKQLKGINTVDRIIMQKLKVAPFVLRKIAGQAREFSQDNLKTAIDLCHRVDIEGKTGKMKTETGLDIIVASLLEKSRT